MNGGDHPDGRQNRPQKEQPSEQFWGTNKPPEKRNGNTLVISEIPQEYLSLTAVSEYFSQFGTVTNVAIEARSKRALVSFTSNFEAYQAWKSDAAIFGNRHVKVLWHKPREGHGGAGQEALEKSATLLANMKALAEGQDIQGEKKAQLVGPEQRLQTTLAELERKDRAQKKERLMAEQKVLLKRSSEGTKEEKLVILKRLKEIMRELEEVDKPKPKVEEDTEMGEKADGEGEGGEKDPELLKLSAQLNSLREKVSVAPHTGAELTPGEHARHH
jgi:RNA-binding protein 26